MKNLYNKLLLIDYTQSIENWFPQTEKLLNNIRNKGNCILISQFDGIGDAILISGIIKELKTYYNLPIIIACYNFVAPIFKMNPHVDKVISLTPDLINYYYIIDKIYNELWINNIFISEAFHLQCFEINNTAILFNYFSGAKKRISYLEYSINKNELIDIEQKIMERHINNHDELLITNKYQFPRNITHMVDRAYWIIEQYLNKQFHHDLYIYPKNPDMIKYIDKNKKNIIVNLGGSLAFKKYPAKELNKFLSLIKNNIILIGGQDSIEDSKYITNQCINLVNKTSLIESIDLINNCDLYIGNDTGMTHIAAACKKPCIVFYKESKDSYQYFPERLSSWLQFQPYKTKSICLRPEKRLIPCSRKKYTYAGCVAMNQNHCIRQISTDEIINAYNKLI